MKPDRTISAETVVCQGDDTVFSTIDGETVMMSISNGMYYGMDTIGSRIWELIAQPRKVMDLCHMLQDEFDVEQEPCLRDVLEFLNDLADENIVKVVDESAT